MTGPDVLDVARLALTTLITTSLPILMVALVVGLVIALFQTITQLQEMTLTFVPKIIAVFISLLMLFPFMGRNLADLMQQIADRIVAGG